MNTRTLLLVFLLISSTVSSQIPNSSFEFWTNSIPDEWITNNVPPLLPVSQSTDSYSGTYAIRGQVVNNNGDPYAPSFQTFGSTGLGFPITQAYTNLTGWYKADMVSTDIGFAQVAIFDNSSTPNVIGTGIANLPTSANYQQFDIPITYIGSAQPASALIIFTIVDTGSTAGFVGSYFIVDDLAFSTSSNIGAVNANSFNVNPNPVSNEINITGDFKAGQSYEVLLINSLGKIVLKKEMKSTATFLPAIDVNELPAGNYFLSLSDFKNSVTKSILISR